MYWADLPSRSKYSVRRSRLHPDIVWMIVSEWAFKDFSRLAVFKFHYWWNLVWKQWYIITIMNSTVSFLRRANTCSSQIKVWYWFLIVHLSCRGFSPFSYNYKADFFCLIFYLYCFYKWRCIFLMFWFVLRYIMESFDIECSLFVTTMFSHVSTVDFHWN